LDSYRESTLNAVDTKLATISMKIKEVMRPLAVIAAILVSFVRMACAIA
jgi:hypothetical protein